MLGILYIVEKETQKIMAGGRETGGAEKFTCSVCGCDLFLFFGLGIYDEKFDKWDPLSCVPQGMVTKD